MRYYLIYSSNNVENFLKNAKIIKDSEIVDINCIDEKVAIIKTKSKKFFEARINQCKLNKEISTKELFIFVELFYNRSVPISNNKKEITNFDTNIKGVEYDISNNI